MLKYRGSQLMRTGFIGLVLIILIIAIGLQPQKLWSWATSIRYHAVFADAGGLSPGNDVKVFGVTKGTVSAITLSHGKALVTFTLDGTVTLGTQTTAHIWLRRCHQESGWRTDAVSHVGARGMAQFMPATARWWCERERIAADSCLPNNPAWALRAMVGYDKYLHDRTPVGMGRYDRMWLALRGYNGGEGHWQAEARKTGQLYPTRRQIDAACGLARRAALHCAENLGYPARILITLQPRYGAWGTQLGPGT